MLKVNIPPTSFRYKTVLDTSEKAEKVYFEDNDEGGDDDDEHE
jgi:hypothetical protein